MKARAKAHWVRRTDSVGRRAATAYLLLALFALRCLIPPGFMLDQQALQEGSLQMTVCDGYSTRVVTVDSQGRIVDEHPDDKQHRKSCPFASLRLAALVGEPPAPATLFAWPIASRPLPVADLVPISDPAGPRVGSRAPPAAGAA